MHLPTLSVSSTAAVRARASCAVALPCTSTSALRHRSSCAENDWKSANVAADSAANFSSALGRRHEEEWPGKEGKGKVVSGY